jgi:hypothetical protein
MGLKINIDGYLVDLDVHSPDTFYSGKDGTRVTNAEWDESKRRVAEAEALVGDAAITWTPIN